MTFCHTQNCWHKCQGGYGDSQAGGEAGDEEEKDEQVTTDYKTRTQRGRMLPLFFVEKYPPKLLQGLGIFRNFVPIKLPMPFRMIESFVTMACNQIDIKQ